VATRLEDLNAMRELLWESVKQADPDKRAPLFARLESVIEQIEKLSPSAKAGDPLDEIAARRSARGGATSRLGQADGSSG
jgi:hypothetical protein